MKKIIFTFLMLMSVSLFAEQYEIKTNMYLRNLKTDIVEVMNINFIEICPVNENVVKAVYSNNIVEYLKKGDSLYFTLLDLDENGKVYESNMRTKIINFTYNKIIVEIVDKEIRWL